PVELNDRLSFVKVVSIADHLHRDALHLQRQSRLPTSVAADDGAVLFDGERHQDAVLPYARHKLRWQDFLSVEFAVHRVRFQIGGSSLHSTISLVSYLSLVGKRKGRQPKGESCHPNSPPPKRGKFKTMELMTG